MSDSPAIPFERLIKDNERLIYKVCRVYAYTRSDRDDLYQEIVLQLWHAWPRFRAEAKFSTWLYRVAINTAITGLRRQKKFIDSCDPAQLPLHQVEERNEDDQLKELYRAIEQLNQIDKAIVMLYLEEKTYEEMEEIMGISNSTLRVKMARIKEKLRQLTKKTA